MEERIDAYTKECGKERGDETAANQELAW